MAPRSASAPAPGQRPAGKRAGIVTTLRNWFFAGVAAAAPIGITIWLVWSFISFVDENIKPLIPRQWNPETYLNVGLPGLGIIIAIFALTVLGALAANLFGRLMLRTGEGIVSRVPLVGSVYTVLKQVIETFASADASSFKEAVLVEYPREGLWVIGFITNPRPDQEILANIPDVIGVLIPASPNLAMGQLVYVRPDRLRRLNISVEKAAKLVVSFGIVHEKTEEPKPIGKISET